MRDDPSALFDIIDALRTAVEYAASVDEEQFFSDRRTQDAVIRQLTVAGEAVKRLTMEYRGRNADVPWRDIAGFRDVAVHQYDSINLHRVWEVVTTDAPRVIALLGPLLPPPPED